MVNTNQRGITMKLTSVKPNTAIIIKQNKVMLKIIGDLTMAMTYDSYAEAVKKQNNIETLFANRPSIEIMNNRNGIMEISHYSLAKVNEDDFVYLKPVVSYFNTDMIMKYSMINKEPSVAEVTKFIWNNLDKRLPDDLAGYINNLKDVNHLVYDHRINPTLIENGYEVCENVPKHLDERIYIKDGYYFILSHIDLNKVEDGLIFIETITDNGNSHVNCFNVYQLKPITLSNHPSKIWDNLIELEYSLYLHQDTITATGKVKMIQKNETHVHFVVNKDTELYKGCVLKEGEYKVVVKNTTMTI